MLYISVVDILLLWGGGSGGVREAGEGKEGERDFFEQKGQARAKMGFFFFFWLWPSAHS